VRPHLVSYLVSYDRTGGIEKLTFMTHGTAVRTAKT